MERELQAFRGGETERNAYLVKQIEGLNAELANVKNQLQVSQLVLVSTKTDDNSKIIAELKRRIE